MTDTAHDPAALTQTVIRLLLTAEESCCDASRAELAVDLAQDSHRTTRPRTARRHITHAADHYRVMHMPCQGRR
jgi:hypothetical protein